MSWEYETSHKGHFNSRLYEAMLLKGFSNSTLAMASGISERQLWNIMHGYSCPRIDTLIRVCQVLHIKIDDIYPIENVI